MEKDLRRKAVVMIIENSGKKVLFTKRNPKRKYLPGVWALPAGHIDPGEDYIKTSKREAREELGIDVNSVELLETVEEPGGDKSLVYVVKIAYDSYTKNPKINTDEFEQIDWMSLSDFYKKYSDDQIGSTLRHLRSKLS